MSSIEHSFSFTARLEKFDSNLWHYHVEVPESIVLSLIEKDNKRVCIT